MERGAWEVHLEGRIQGIGLRPWTVRSARALGLAGSVRNSGSCVQVELEGNAAALGAWLAELRAHFAESLEGVEVRDCVPRGLREFAIEASDAGDARMENALPRIPADIAVCELCIEELFDSRARRHRYAFTHCATCGPRSAVLLELPYDRERTTLRAFRPCADCRSEYENVADRRFHAQTLACPACGPRVTAFEPGGGLMRESHAAVEWAAAVLGAGGIVAMKGYGGFHLLCDATSEAAVGRLRERKGRAAKPLAVLVPDLRSARRRVQLRGEDEEWLTGAARAVVLAPRRAAGRGDAGLAASVAPGTRDLGVILPYTPLHLLLLFAPGQHPRRAAARFAALVFTSANRSGEPTLHANELARERLAGLADLVLAHDRPVARPNDDPVVRSAAPAPLPIRLSRGTAPLILPLPAALHAAPPILALGGDLKCAPALAARGELLLAEHVGDLACAEALDALEARVRELCRLAGVEPQAIACDLHPGYVSGGLAKRWGVPVIAVQHHRAHALACLADAGAQGPALALVLDGAGWGEDGTLWGGELLRVELGRCERLGHLERVPLPGGDAAVREPWRMAAVWLRRAFPEGPPQLPWHRRRDPAALDQLTAAAERGLNSPLTSSCGRLFDALASLLDLGDCSRYEGQLAMALEATAAQADAVPLRASDAWGADLLSAGEMRVADLVRDAVLDHARGAAGAAVSRQFHERLATRLASHAIAASRHTGLRCVALTGGCFQNRLLCALLAGRLRRAGLQVLVHRRIPANDGGLAVGQAVAAVAELALHGRRAASPARHADERIRVE